MKETDIEFVLKDYELLHQRASKVGHEAVHISTEALGILVQLAKRGYALHPGIEEELIPG